MQVAPPPPEHELATAAAWHREGERVAIATVIRTWGSAPRRPGARLVLTASGRMAGSVSGGCIEAEVAAHAAEIIETGTPTLLHFDVADARAWSVGLACGGGIDVLVERLDRIAPLERLQSCRAARQAAALASRLSDGRTWILPDEAAPAPLREALDAGRSGPVVSGDEEWFVDVHLPPSRLLIVGAVQIAQSLAPLAQAIGLAPLVIDPRPAFASAERFPGTPLDARFPDAAIAAACPDRETAIVALTHDPKLDDPALIAALGSDAFYIGALGSRRTQAARLERLALAGIDATRLRGPVGLAIGAATPAEIALSIVAEIIAARRGAALGVR